MATVSAIKLPVVPASSGSCRAKRRDGTPYLVRIWYIITSPVHDPKPPLAVAAANERNRRTV